MAVEVFAVKIDRGVDDRPLAVMGADNVHPDLHFRAHGFRVGPRGAGARGVVPFDIENGGHLHRSARHIGDEPGRLFARRAAEIIEMIGRMGDAGGARAAPVVPIAVVSVVAALGGLHEGEGDAGLADLVPVNVALPFGNVDAVDRIAVRVVLAKLHRLAVAIASLAGRWQLDDFARRRGCGSL